MSVTSYYLRMARGDLALVPWHPPPLVQAHLVMEVRGLAEIQHFFNQKLGISERRIKTITWPEVLHRLVQVGSGAAQGVGRLGALHLWHRHACVEDKPSGGGSLPHRSLPGFPGRCGSMLAILAAPPQLP